MPKLKRGVYKYFARKVGGIAYSRKDINKAYGRYKKLKRRKR